jgi:hypothetical protein
MRHKSLIRLLVEVIELLTAGLNVVFQIIISSVGKPIQFFGAERIVILKVNGLLGVVSRFIIRNVVLANLIGI